MVYDYGCGGISNMSKFDVFNEKVISIFDELVKHGFANLVAVRKVPGYINDIYLVRDDGPILPDIQRNQLETDYQTCAKQCGILESEINETGTGTGYLVVSRRFYESEKERSYLEVREYT